MYGAIPPDDHPHGARRVQRRADRQHGEDQRKKLPLDKGERLVGVDAAGQQDHRHGNHRQRQDRRETQRRQQHDPGQRAERDGRVPAAEGPRRRVRDVDELPSLPPAA